VGKRDRPFPPTYFVVGLIAMIVLHFVFPIARLIGSAWGYFGLIPVGVGIVLNLWTDGLFKRYGTEVKPFRASSALVIEGPFRFTRHPMYLGGLLVYIGVAVLLGSLSPFLVIAAMFWLVTIHFVLPEEQDMTRQLGDRYPRYKRRVQRWV